MPFGNIELWPVQTPRICVVFDGLIVTWMLEPQDGDKFPAHGWGWAEFQVIQVRNGKFWVVFR